MQQIKKAKDVVNSEQNISNSEFVNNADSDREMERQQTIKIVFLQNLKKKPDPNIFMIQNLLLNFVNGNSSVPYNNRDKSLH